MPTISISQPVYEELKKRSKSWEDTPNKIIAGLLAIEEKVSLKATKKYTYNPRDISIPSAIVKKIIIFVLGKRAPGVVSRRIVEAETIKLMESNNLLSGRDLEKYPSGIKSIEHLTSHYIHQLREIEVLQRSDEGGLNSLKLTEDGLQEYDEIKADSRLLTGPVDGSDDLDTPRTTYRYTRLCFIREKIDPLGPEDSFRIICDDGIFQMTKNEFYEVFNNVIATRSYKANGLYHSPSPPRKAKQFKIL